MDSWIESKSELPVLGEVIEGITPKNWLYSKFGRDYFAFVEVDNEFMWVTTSLNDMDYKDLRVTHWRNIQPDHRGRKPFVKIKKYNGYWEPKVIFKKVNE